MFTLTVAFILSLITDEGIRAKVQKALDAAPSYFWVDAASSSGKYHPFFDLGEGGVLRHSILVAYFAHEGALARGLSQWEIDCITAAGLLHDLVKRGVDGGDHTVFEHPLLAAKFLRDLFEGDADMAFIASLIEPHMGKWNTSKYSDVVLPTPVTVCETIVSMADMVASREVLGRLHKAETWGDAAWKEV